MGGGLAGVFVMAGLDPIGRPPHPAHCVRRPLPAWRGEAYLQRLFRCVKPVGQA